jgi:hypothetical protein
MCQQQPDTRQCHCRSEAFNALSEAFLQVLGKTVISPLPPCCSSKKFCKQVPEKLEQAPQHGKLYYRPFQVLFDPGSDGEWQASNVRQSALDTHPF